MLYVVPPHMSCAPEYHRRDVAPQSAAVLNSALNPLTLHRLI